MNRPPKLVAGCMFGKGEPHTKIGRLYSYFTPPYLSPAPEITPSKPLTEKIGPIGAPVPANALAVPAACMITLLRIIPAVLIGAVAALAVIGGVVLRSLLETGI